MSDPELYKDGERVKLVTQQHKVLEKELADIYFRWNELTKEMEGLSEEVNKFHPLG